MIFLILLISLPNGRSTDLINQIKFLPVISAPEYPLPSILSPLDDDGEVKVEGTR